MEILIIKGLIVNTILVERLLYLLMINTLKGGFTTMKNKKLVLNKKTVAHLNVNDMDSLHGGFWSYNSCAVTNDCQTDVACTGDHCECTFACTIPCPISIAGCDTDVPCT